MHPHCAWNTAGPTPPRSEQLMDLYDFIRSINRYQVFKLRFGKETLSPLVPIRAAADLPRHDDIFCFLPQHLNAFKKPR